jgi:hypothetical protein
MGEGKVEKRVILRNEPELVGVVLDWMWLVESML